MGQPSLCGPSLTEASLCGAYLSPCLMTAVSKDPETFACIFNIKMCITVEPGYNDIGLYDTPLIVSAINSSLLTITLNSSFITTRAIESFFWRNRVRLYSESIRVLSVRQARFVTVGERKARGRRSRLWRWKSTNWKNVAWQEIVIADVNWMCRAAHRMHLPRKLPTHCSQAPRHTLVREYWC
jgi:hypothetical protein